MERLKELSFALARTADAGTIEVFLRAILTPGEIEDISSRWEIFRMLSAGINQRKIAEDLGVSLCKITRGSREFKDKQKVLEQILSETDRKLI